MKVFECVDSGQYEADFAHAFYMLITAKNRNQAKYKYSKHADTEYKDVLCRTRKNYPQWG